MEWEQLMLSTIGSEATKGGKRGLLVALLLLHS
jgi:hypothetical protein